MNVLSERNLQNSPKSSPRPFLRSLSALAFGLVLIPQMGCIEDDLAAVAPLIDVSYAADESTSPCAEGSESVGGSGSNTYLHSECAHVFSDVVQGQGQYLRLWLHNPSPINLTIQDITIEGDPAFRLVSIIEDSVKRFEYAEVVVQFAPTLASTVQGTLVIDTDATNVTEPIRITLTGTGLDVGAPEMVITPAECNFGDVGVGVTAFCDLTLENVGNRDLEITSVGFSPETDTAVFGSQTIFPIPTFVAPGTGMSVRLFAQPQNADGASGALLLGTNDPNHLESIVPLSVTGAVAPTAIPEVLTINGTPVSSPNPQVGPLDDVLLTGERSVPANQGATIVDYMWEIVNQPAESTVTLTTPNSVTTALQFSSSGGNRQGLDVAGTYEILLTVTDSNGLTSTNDARITLNAIPQEALLIQLTWDTPTGDIDLHLNKDGGNSCGTSTCYFFNCKAVSNPLEWDTISGRSAGDPTLDVDDLTGYGPESINVDFPVDATYKVGVDYYWGSQDSWATVKVYINSALQYENSAQMRSGEWWDVVDIAWANGAATVTPGSNSAGSAGSAPGWACN
ncbi:MAG: choice-of-anchor D domain-containing protein [Deltaproteobacteria bacterium]|nr:choice-of-anchor D domain-containing protein [Deltaproteobacteria bacterium]